MNISVTSRDLMSVAEIKRVIDCFTSPGFMGFFCGMSSHSPFIPKAVHASWSFNQSHVDAMNAGTLGWSIYSKLIRPWERQMIGKAQIHKNSLNFYDYLRFLSNAQALKYAVLSEYLWNRMCEDPQCHSMLTIPNSPFVNHSSTYQLGNIRISGDIHSFMDNELFAPGPILEDNQVLIMSGEASYNFDEPVLTFDDVRFPDDPVYLASMRFGIGVVASIHELDI